MITANAVECNASALDLIKTAVAPSVINPQKAENPDEHRTVYQNIKSVAWGHWCESAQSLSKDTAPYKFVCVDPNSPLGPHQAISQQLMQLFLIEQIALPVFRTLKKEARSFFRRTGP